MDKIEKVIYTTLCTVTGVLVVMLVSGYSGFQWYRKPHDPFITDRVVEVRIVMAEKEWQQMRSNPRAEQYARADFWFDGHKYSNIAVRPKGNSSLMSVSGGGSVRFSLKIDFNFFNSSQTFCGLKKINLNNGFSDPTLIREVLGYELFENMDLPTPRCSFVDVYVNDQHLGVYTQVEAIDKAFLSRHFSSPNGNLYKPEIGAANLNWTKEEWEKNRQNKSDTNSPQTDETQLLNFGGSRLSDLIRLLEREQSIQNENQSQEAMARFPDGFPGPQFPGQGDRQDRPLNPGAQEGDRMPPDFGGFNNDMDNGPPPGDFFGAQPPEGEFAGRQPRDPNDFFANRERRGFREGGPGFGGFGPGGDRAGRGGRQGGPGGPGFGRRGDLLETMGLKTNESYQNHTALFHFLEVLNRTPDETFPQEIEKVLDVDQVLRYLAVSTLIVHLDNYTGMGHNYYLYEINGRFTILPWDLNMGFGTFKMGVTMQDITDFYIDEPVSGSMEDRPLVGRLLAYTPYLEKYHKYLEQLLEGGFAEGVIESWIEYWSNLIRPYVEKDETKFFTMEQFEKGLREGTIDDVMGGPQGMRGPAGLDRPMNAQDGRLGQMPAAQGQEQPQRAGEFGRRGFGRRGGGGPGGPGGGMGAPGLRSFITKRRLSVRGQLDGTLPSKPTEEQRQQMNQSGPMMFGPGGGR